MEALTPGTLVDILHDFTGIPGSCLVYITVSHGVKITLLWAGAIKHYTKELHVEKTAWQP
jgi:hypothetical protein